MGRDKNAVAKKLSEGDDGQASSAEPPTATEEPASNSTAASTSTAATKDNENGAYVKRTLRRDKADDQTTPEPEPGAVHVSNSSPQHQQQLSSTNEQSPPRAVGSVSGSSTTNNASSNKQEKYNLRIGREQAHNVQTSPTTTTTSASAVAAAAEPGAVSTNDTQPSSSKSKKRGPGLRGSIPTDEEKNSASVGVMDETGNAEGSHSINQPTIQTSSNPVGATSNDEEPSAPLLMATLVDSNRDIENDSEALERMRQNILSEAVTAEEVKPVDDQDEAQQRRQKKRMICYMAVLLVVIIVAVVVGVIVGRDDSDSDSATAVIPTEDGCPVIFDGEPLLQLTLNEMTAINTSSKAFHALTLNESAIPCRFGGNSRGMGNGIEVIGTGNPMTVFLCQSPKITNSAALSVVTIESDHDTTCYDVSCGSTTNLPWSNSSASCPGGSAVLEKSWNSLYGETYYVVLLGSSLLQDDDDDAALINVLLTALPNDECPLSIGPIEVGNSFEWSGVVSLKTSGDYDTYNITEYCSRVHYIEDPGHWFTVVASGPKTTFTVSSNFTFQPGDLRQDTITLSLFSGDGCLELTCIESIERTRGLEVAFEVDTEPERQYRVFIQGYSGNNKDMEYKLRIRNAELAIRPPENDDCATAMELAFPPDNASFFDLSWMYSFFSVTYNATRTVIIPATSIGATMDDQERLIPTCTIEQIGPGVWFKVVGTGKVMRASTCPGDFSDLVPTENELTPSLYSATLQVYEGSCGDDLTCTEGVSTSFCKSLPFNFGVAEWRTKLNQTYYLLVHSLFEDDLDIHIYENTTETSFGGNVYLTVQQGDFILSLEELEDNATIWGEDCPLELEVFCLEPCGAESVDLECLQQPNEMEFLYVVAPCFDDPNFGQTQYECQDFNGGPNVNTPGAYIEIRDRTGRVYYSNWTSNYETVVISDNGNPFEEFHNVSVYSSNVTTSNTLLQNFVYSSVCPFSGLQAGDLFGSLLLLSFSNDRQGTVNAVSNSTLRFAATLRLSSDAPQSNVTLLSMEVSTPGTLGLETTYLDISSVDVFGADLISGSRPLEFDINVDEINFYGEYFPLVFHARGIAGSDELGSPLCVGTSILELDFDN